MPAGRMHADEADIDAPLVRRLIATQFPEWADLPVEGIPSAGTDNAIFRLGPSLAVRLPRVERATGQADKEQAWLPRLAPLLPLTIPQPLVKGVPGEGYPWAWSVHRWIDGETAAPGLITDPHHSAVALGRFVVALQQADPDGGPAPGAHSSFRGGPLAWRDAPTRAAIASLGGTLDTRAATAAWDVALLTQAWDGPPVWVHGDLQAGNLLAADGELVAVIDFGCLAVGDPAGDAMAGWTYFSAETRNAFRAELAVDDATWARGRGWALSFGLIALPYYRGSNPVLADIAQRAIDEVLEDHRRGG